ncbi:hypothetical protein BpHYR1_016577 [Brachionus plicatilis]|uniref:Uncharacterized protein n=1 Tax=Brachionus plicatilis TaxID=10195 RepID=A0A3M7QLX3_BRAPC|nr:hypothetical protein BpHYR1_016577 [Brachionus plicatilis]
MFSSLQLKNGFKFDFFTSNYNSNLILTFSLTKTHSNFDELVTRMTHKWSNSPNVLLAFEKHPLLALKKYLLSHQASGTRLKNLKRIKSVVLIWQAFSYLKLNSLKFEKNTENSFFNFYIIY